MVQSALAQITSGGAYALLACCLILIYQTTGVLNFTAAATGTFGTFVMAVLTGHGWAYGPAAVVAILVGAALSGAFGLILARWFFGASPAYRTTASAVLLVGLDTIAFRVFGDDPRTIPSVTSSAAATISGVVVPWVALITLALAIAVAILVTVTLRRTGIGLRLRALSERPTTVELLGIRARVLAVSVWLAGGALATVAMLLIAPTQSSSFSVLSLLVVPGMAAALIGLFRSYPRAIAGGLALGIAQGVLSQISGLDRTQVVLPFAVMVVVLTYAERRARWDETR